VPWFGNERGFAPNLGEEATAGNHLFKNSGNEGNSGVRKGGGFDKRKGKGPHGFEKLYL